MSDKNLNETRNVTSDLISYRKYDEVIRLLEKELKDNKDKDLSLMLAKAYFYVEKSAQAKKILDQLIEEDKNNHQAIYLLSRLKYHIYDKKEEAVNLALKAIKLNQDNSFYYSLAALIFSALKNQKRAVKLANEALEIDNQNYEAHLVLAINEDGEKPIEEAYKHYSIALKTGPGYENGEFYLNYIHLQLAKSKKGYELIKEAYLASSQFDYYEWLLKFSFMRNQPFNLPFIWLDEFTISVKALIILLIALFAVVGVMYINEDFCIGFMEVFKWICSAVFIIYLPYQILVYAVLSIYLQFILVPKLAKSVV